MLDKCKKLQELVISIRDVKDNELGVKALTKSISQLVLLEKLEFSYYNYKSSLT